VTYAVDSKGECFHRGFTKMPAQELVNNFDAKKAFRALDNAIKPEMAEKTKALKAPKAIQDAIGADGSKILSETPQLVTIEDPKNNAIIRICKVNKWNE
jgi:hypothetical protein